MRQSGGYFWCIAPLLAALGHAVPAAACTLFAPFQMLPGEPSEAYRLRASSLLLAQYDEERRLWQQNRYDRADQVFIARVIHSKSATAQAPDRRMMVQPLRALKGELPISRVTIHDVRSISCQRVVGGVRKSAAAGDYTIVFIAPPSLEDGASIKEIPIHEARDPRLLEAITNF